ncbi:sulfurtransferase [Pontibacter sp. G13]|uniref:sulfurtransferase n=1 Tax=Pontibacter sp. G13 TaxID=3074898 RepID=UPI002889791B|nr:sulfurtransferase [Pontibacter sp. G13]WNJ17440.1 sulfurtransferase [Pontibacter sp. G13]
MIEPLVSPQWLKDNLNNSNLIILDASVIDNQAGITSEYTHQKIEGAQHVDLKHSFSDTESPFPNTFPSEAQFQMECRSLGIHDSSRIIVYDNLGIYTSPRIWWMFRAMGHKKVHVLNGGLPNWIRQGFDTVEHFGSKDKPGNFRARLQAGRVKSINDIRSNLSQEQYIVVDARNEQRFKGMIHEPRAGLRSGNIPKSINIPYNHVLKDGRYKSHKELKRIFEDAGVDERPIAFSCGSGVTACILLLAAEMVLSNDTSVYDGSWTEYGSLIPEGM